MNKRLTLAVIAAVSLSLVVAASAQQQQPTTTPATSASTTTNSNSTSSRPQAASAAGPLITATTSPSDMARAAINAFGGAKYRSLKNMVLIGTADLFSPNSTQSLPAKFAMVVAGERYRLEIDARPAFAFQQISDGQQTYSSVRGFDLPPPNKFGLPLLLKFDQPGYTVSAIPDRKKLRGFRITDTEGNTTDYFVDPETARVMSYETTFNGNTFGIEHKKFRDVEGVLIPISFSQKFDTPQGSFFADYSVRDVKINQELADDMFAIPNR